MAFELWSLVILKIGSLMKLPRALNHCNGDGIITSRVGVGKSSYQFLLCNIIEIQFNSSFSTFLQLVCGYEYEG